MRTTLQSLLLLIGILLNTNTVLAQTFTSYYTGASGDIQTEALGGICLMGGATEDDNAMKWFLERANGGDILVIRASGSDGYNDYFYSELGVQVNSVETIVFHERDASFDEAVHEKIKNAEAIWMAGGDQWKYVSFWRNTPVDSLINDAITSRNLVIGGTSAGMAILGSAYFSAKNGTITSEEALMNPYHPNVTVDTSRFVKTPYMQYVVTDTHYDDRDRKGRHVVFLARLQELVGDDARGIACDEYTAVCIDTSGLARVYGQFPDEDDNAYFISTNCELTDNMPENMQDGQSLEWNHNRLAISVYEAKGTPSGLQTLDLSDWETGSGGRWMNWYVENGEFQEVSGSVPSCNTSSIQVALPSLHDIYPNPALEFLNVKSEKATLTYTIISLNGEMRKVGDIDEEKINLRNLPEGLHLLKITDEDGVSHIFKIVIKR